MYFFRFALLLLAFLMSGQGQAVGPIASVVKVFGQVTQLAPGDLIARKAEVGDNLVRETSIVTGKKSFVQIVYKSGASLNLGSNTKIVIRETLKNKKGLIVLLKGKLRSSYTNPSIRKKKTDPHKFYVRTRTAAMGVRGTEFLTVYNPETTLTNTLTFSGEVEMKKTDINSSSKKSRKKKVRKRISQKSVDDLEVDIEVEDYPEESVQDVESLFSEGVQKNGEVVNVQSGQFAASLAGVKKVTRPVRISPIQYAALSNNKSLVAKDQGSKDIARYSEQADSKLRALPQTEQTVPAEGVSDLNNGIFAAKSGGFIDLETGVYVPPSKKASFNVKTKVYEDKYVGSFDEQTGQYLAPKGLKLDAIKGFVPLNKKNRRDLLASRILNKGLRKDLIVSKKKKVDVMNLFSKEELFSKNIVSLTWQNAPTTLSVTGDTTFSGDQDYESDSSSILGLTWEIASNSKWRPVIKVSRYAQTFNNNGLSIDEQSIDTSIKTEFSVKFNWKRRVNAVIGYGIDQRLVLVHPTEDSVLQSRFDRITRNVFRFGIEWDVFKSSRFSTPLEMDLLYSPSDDKENLTIGPSVGFNLDYGLKYWLERKTYLKLGAEFESFSQTFTYPTIEYDVSSSSTGFYLASGYVF